MEVLRTYIRENASLQVGNIAARKTTSGRGMSVTAQ